MPGPFSFIIFVAALSQNEWVSYPPPLVGGGKGRATRPINKERYGKR